ncbi:MAG: spore germination protein [Clostridia bacterium]|nr:spore germination protein [Clostridia bacterium]
MDNDTMPGGGEMMLSGDFERDVQLLTRLLRVGESFDMRKHIVVPKNGQKCAFFFISAFANSQVIGDLLRYCINTEELRLEDSTIPYVEGSRNEKVSDIIKAVMSGLTCLIPEGDGGAYLMDMRVIPSRGIQEPANDKVLRGARDGFCESLQPNAALIRRRIRDPRLTFSVMTVGESTKTDMCLCYVEGLCDMKYVERLRERIKALKLKTVNFQGETVAEALVRKKWYNPFPKVRYTERPDAAAASLMEGGVLLICDNSPSVMVLPTSIFSFMQETDDFCFPPLTGSYLRVVRFLISLLSLYLLPVWYWMLSHVDRLPEALRFLAVSQETSLPILFQILVAELAIDGMRLASLNTPDSLGSALSAVTGLILGEFAVESGWFAPDVILYVAFVTIANFSQTSYELGYAIKFMRLLLLILTAFLGGWGLLAGTLVMIFLIAQNGTVFSYKGYLYPLVPFNGKALKSLIVRRKYDSGRD